MADEGDLMEVTVEHFLDAGEQDADGLWDYYYEGDNYLFRHSGEELRGRTYVDEPSRANFSATVRQCQESGVTHEAVQYLRSVGVREFFALGGPSGGYTRLDMA